MVIEYPAGNDSLYACCRLQLPASPALSSLTTQ